MRNARATLVGRLSLELFVVLTMISGMAALYLYALLLAKPSIGDYNVIVEEVNALREIRDVNGGNIGDLAKIRVENERLKKQAEALAHERGCPEVKDPPLIVLSDAEGFSFRSGSEEIDAAFLNQVRDVVIPRLIAEARSAGLNLIEVVGHTDEVPLSSRSGSNLDSGLFAELGGYKTVGGLQKTDNVGLSMTRAVAMVVVLKRDSRIIKAGLEVVPLAAGPLIDTNGNLAIGYQSSQSDPNRRRVEFRLRKRGK